jgi:crotonobetainyl-CoA:carnitine CoA-transferase CaiB-like acyl-CoA transferase
MQTAAEVATDVQTEANHYLVEATHPEHGPFHVVSSPVQIGDQRVETQGAAPDLGQDTETVLLDLGYAWEQIAELKEKGAIS